MNGQNDEGAGIDFWGDDAATQSFAKKVDLSKNRRVSKKSVSMND